MLENLKHLERRAAEIYTPSKTEAHGGIVFVQTERDELAEAHRRGVNVLLTLAAPIVHLAALAFVVPALVARWLRQWRRTPQIG